MQSPKPTMYAQSGRTLQKLEWWLILQIQRLPITLNALHKAPPIAAPRQPAINGVLNFTSRPCKYMAPTILVIKRQK